MNTRTLGADLTVSAVGLGCMGFSHAYGAPTERSEAVQAIQAAYDMGYTLFDTAETYGTAADPHEKEKLVGEALKDVRDKVQIVTKFGIHFDETSTAVNKPLIPDARPETIRSSVEGSLRRLQTGHIDLYFQHRMDPNVEPEMQTMHILGRNMAFFLKCKERALAHGLVLPAQEPVQFTHFIR